MIIRKDTPWQTSYSLHFVILPTSGFTGISDLTKMYSGI